MIARVLQWTLAAAAAAAFSAPGVAAAPWETEFGIDKCKLVTAGRNDYFVLEPGFQLVLEGGDKRLEITVLAETRQVAGVATRVVEEKEWKNGELYEISRNYFALCEQTKDVFYFGEDVDYYEKGRVVKHDGSWLAGVKGNKPGLMMPGAPKAKQRYYQEIAPGVAMDRAEIVSLNETCSTPAGTFQRCLKIKEGSAMNIFAKEYKYYAPGIGLVQDEDLRLVKYGFVKAR
ncbi:MAG: TapB family protein [Betaproteobacteria bacterium]